MKTCIQNLGIIVALTMIVGYASAQTEPKPSPNDNRYAAGMSIGHFRHDPGVAAEFTSRAVLQNHLSLRVRASVQWLEAYKGAHNHWVSYRTYAAALVYHGQLFDRTRFFAEFGMLGIAPDIRFSDQQFIRGFYQFNGLELTLVEKKSHSLCFWLGVGPAFINAHAEKIEGNPGYGNGLHYMNGLRIYF